MNVSELLAALENRLGEIQARYDEWYAPIAHLRKTWDFNRSDDYWGAISQLEQQILANYNPYAESAEVYDKLCPYYWAAPSEMRIAIRTMFKKKLYWAEIAPFKYVDTVITRLETTPDINTLRMGLAAMSIEDCTTDYRDTLMALKNLAKAAKRASIDAKPQFLEIAALSSEHVSSGGDMPMKELFAQFYTFKIAHGL
jgi:hypothetical protein